MHRLLIGLAVLALFSPWRADATVPVMSNGGPFGILPADVGSITLRIDTDVLAHCKYASTPGVAYASMPTAFTSGTSTTHLATVNVQNDTRYDLYIKCADVDGNANSTDYNVYFGVARGTPPDTTAPVISEVSPSGLYAGGTSALALALRTDENASCRYGTSSAAYAALPYLFTETGGNSHRAPLSGLKDGAAYSFYVRCADAAKNVNAADQLVSFSIATSTSGIIAAPVVPVPQVTSAAPKAAAPALVFSRDLKYGMRDAWVLLLQIQLARTGHYKGSYDGVFGDRTLGAVKAFQSAHKIPATGFVGPMTRAKLNTGK